MPTVKVELESRPEALMLVRGMLTGVADLLGFNPELVHDLKTVVGEACNNVMLHAYDNGTTGPLTVGLRIGEETVEASVRDWGSGIRYVAPSVDRLHVGLAIISAVADQAQFVRAPGGGTEVRMAFAGPTGITALPRSANPHACDPIPVELSGDAVLTLSPVRLLRGVLARVSTALAAQAHFSFERLHDLRRLTEELAAHAEAAACGEGVSAAIVVGSRRLELAVGPFRPAGDMTAVAVGGSPRSSGDTRSPADAERGRPEAAFLALEAELRIEPVAGAEIWRLVVCDDRRPR